WMFTIVGIAFLGAAAGEVFRRLQVRVLAEPLERTGIFLPVLPVLAFWILPADRYAAVLFLVALLYAFLAVAKRSLAFGLLAVAAAHLGASARLVQTQTA